jgi:hypothetical protein
MIGFGQGWERTFGDIDKTENGYAVQQTTDGGYIIAGESYNGTSSIVLIKTDEYGYEIWRQTFNEINDASAKSVQLTSDGGYIICGSKYQEATGGGSGIANYDVVLIKVNYSGQKVWSKYFGGPWGQSGYSVQQTTDGGLDNSKEKLTLISS